MNQLKDKSLDAGRRAHRVRASVRKSGQYPRLSIFISQRHVTAQIIDDASGKTLAYATTVGAKELPSNLTARAEFVGAQVAAKAKKAKVAKAAFDRGQRRYHGRVKALAEAARAGGLEI